VPDELVSWSNVPGIASLGSGIGFASIHETGASELDYGDIDGIAPQLRADILLFDYWVQNEDRKLGKKGGNPNLLWVALERRPVMIDHNLAFDVEFDSQILFTQHAFGADLETWDAGFRAKRQKKLLAILGALPDILDSIPEEWFADDAIRDVPLAAEVARMKRVLRRVEATPDEFWEVCS
jgi:hypothetical protein